MKSRDKVAVRRDRYCEDVLSSKVPVRVVWEDERVMAFHHTNPQSDIHIVIIPKKHVPSILDSEALDGLLLSSMVTAVQEVAKTLDLNGKGFQLRINAASPEVTPHMHWHVLGPGIPP